MQPFARHNPLTDDEFARLDAFLDNTKNSRAMNLEQIDGFFTALICGPEVVMPGEYLPYVWGNEQTQDGIFENLEEAQEILSLLNRHWNTIAKTLYEGGVYLPLMHEDENGSVTGNEWAKGFLRGMGLRRVAGTNYWTTKLMPAVWCRCFCWPTSTIPTPRCALRQFPQRDGKTS